MFRTLSRLWIVTIAYVFGLLTALVLIGGIGLIVSTSITIRDIEEKTAFPTISDQYIGEYPEVYIRDMTLMEMVKEGKELADLGDGLTLNVLISRWDLILSDRADVFLTPRVRDLPLKQVFSEDGFDLIMNSVYIGEFRGYEQREIDGELVWYDPNKDEPLKGINRVVSKLTLAETLSSDFNFSSLLDDLTLGEALGYKLENGEYYNNGEKVTGMMGVVADCHINEVSDRFTNAQLCEIFGYELGEDGYYYDKNDKKVTGIMSVICESTINSVPDRINSATFAEVLGYELAEDGAYYDNGEKVTGVMSVIADCTVTNAPDKINSAMMGEILGYTYDADKGYWVDSEAKPVHVLMNKISGKNIKQLDGITDELTLGDVIPEDDRQGLVSFISEETKLDDIPEAVDKAFNGNSLRAFIDADVIQFTDQVDSEGNVIKTAEQRKEEFLLKPVADKSIPELIDKLFVIPDSFFQ